MWDDVGVVRDEPGIEARHSRALDAASRRELAGQPALPTADRRSISPGMTGSICAR